MLDILRLLQLHERRRGLLLLAVASLVALLDAAVVAAMFPFLRLLFSPDPRYIGGIMQRLAPFLDRVDPRPQVAVGACVVLLVLVSRGASLFANGFETRFVHDVGHRLSVRLLATYLALPYERLVQADLTRSAKNVLQEGDHLVQGALNPLVQIAESGMTLLAICAVLLRVSTKSAMAISGGLAVAYGAFYLARRERVRETGALRLRANQHRFKIAAEAFGGLKEIRVARTEHAFLRRFQVESREFARLNAEHQELQVGSRYVIEGLAVSMVICVAILLTTTHRNVSTAMPALGFFVFGVFRMLPPFHQLLASATQLRFLGPTLDALSTDLRDEHLAGAPTAIHTLAFDRAVHVDGVTIQYPGRPRPALDAVSIEIMKGETIALLGRTGAGKSTLADVVLGLLHPAAGSLSVDGVKVVDELCAAWQANIGYVPQRIYLADDTIRANIAFGVSADEIDEAALGRAARLAQVEEFVSELPEDFGTVIGERGVRLSGGQQQRIGIARALYRRPQLLVLDEATSDLDSATQATIMESLQELDGGMTMLVIAHRHAAVVGCTRAYLLENGRIVAHGSVADVISASEALVTDKVIAPAHG